MQYPKNKQSKTINENKEKRKKIIFELMSTDFLDPNFLEKEISENNINLTDEEMDAFIIKLSKQNKQKH